MSNGVVRRGRPPDTDPSETRRRIVDAARQEFAAQGYAAATNRTIAARAGLTTGAVYHHYGSKTELYAAVYDDAHDFVYAHFAAAASRHSTFVEMLDAVLDIAASINSEDPSMAAFIGAARVDRRRHPELATATPDDRVRRTGFFAALIDVGTATGEIEPERRTEMSALIDTVIVGLNDASSDDVRRQRAAIRSIKTMIRSLVGPVRTGEHRPALAPRA